VPEDDLDDNDIDFENLPGAPTYRPKKSKKSAVKLTDTLEPEKAFRWKDGKRMEVPMMSNHDKSMWERAEELDKKIKQKKPVVAAAPPPPSKKVKDEMVMADYTAPPRGSLLQQQTVTGGWDGYPYDSPDVDLRRSALSIKKADFTVNSLMDKIRRGKLNLRPAYQREYVWDNKTASKLIESLLLNVPIPTLFFHEVRNGCLEVVDGKQRLTSVWSFIQNEFPDLEPFRLSGLEVYEELNGACFADLNEIQQETIKDYAINVHTIMHQSQPEFVFEVFERLNMGSTQLNEQELRNCIYQGVYTELLAELAQNKHMMLILKSDAPHMRMKDRELILRFFAMSRSTPYHFVSPVKSWLNAEIREQKHCSRETIDEMREMFERTVALAWDVFGIAAFRPIKTGKKGLTGMERFETGEVNLALWDTVMYSLIDKEPKVILQHKEEIVDALVELMQDPTFKKLMVSQAKAVVARHEVWDERLTAIIEG